MHEKHHEINSLDFYAEGRRRGGEIHCVQAVFNLFTVW